MIRTFTILGEPVGEGRPRAVRMGPSVRMHAAPKSAEWRALAAKSMQEQWARAPLSEVVSVSILAVTRRPKMPKKAGKDRLHRPCKPDVDNIAKSCLDALVQAGVVVDDRQVVKLMVERVTAAVNETPHTLIEVRA